MLPTINPIATLHEYSYNPIECCSANPRKSQYAYESYHYSVVVEYVRYIKGTRYTICAHAEAKNRKLIRINFSSLLSKKFNSYFPAAKKNFLLF